MKKIFHNAFGGSDEHLGWYVCDFGDYEYKNKTDKPWFVTDVERNCTTVSKDPDVQAVIKEREDLLDSLHNELVEIAKRLKVKFLTYETFEGFSVESQASEADVKEVWVDEEDGKKLSEALIAAGWVHEFIAIGP